MNTFKHQGDICFVSITKKEFEAAKLKGKVENHNGSFIVGYGEATGHNHTVTVDRPEEMEVINVNGEYYLRIASKAEVTHQEHKPIRFETPTYRKVTHEREFDHFMNIQRRVVD